MLYKIVDIINYIRFYREKMINILSLLLKLDDWN